MQKSVHAAVEFKKLIHRTGSVYCCKQFAREVLWVLFTCLSELVPVGISSWHNIFTLHACVTSTTIQIRTPQTMDSKRYTCYIWGKNGLKSSYRSKDLKLKHDSMRPSLHYIQRRFKKKERGVYFLKDNAWVLPWSKDVGTVLSVQFVSLPGEKGVVPPLTVCGSCIRDNHSSIWEQIREADSRCVWGMMYVSRVRMYHENDSLRMWQWWCSTMNSTLAS